MSEILELASELSFEALKAENQYLNSALVANPAFTKSESGLLSINNERYYQFVIARYLFKHLPYKTGLEHHSTDLVIFSKDSERVEVAVEMKRWMSSTGNPEIPSIREDFERLRSHPAKHALMLIFTAHPEDVSIEENTRFITDKLGGDIKLENWNCRSFKTVGKDGNDSVFCVISYPVK